VSRRYAPALFLATALVFSCSGPPLTVVNSAGPPPGFTTVPPSAPMVGAATGVPAGTTLFVSVGRTINSAQRTMWNPAPPDQFIVAYDVVDSAGYLRIASGTSVQAMVDVHPRGRIGRQGTIGVDFTMTSTIEGFVVPLDGYYKWSGESREGLTIGLTVGMLFIYPPFNFLHLLMRGGDVVLPSGSILAVVVAPG
jgi:hypothetical protein